jgi:glutamate-1-semialdehyde aminotransferase
MKEIDRGRLRAALAREQDRFVDAHPRSRELFEQARQHLFGGVPMSWMTEWAGAFPVFVREASGAYFSDVDGHRYLDLCLGDTGAMTGHAPRVAVETIVEQIWRGVTFMLPTEDAVWVGRELARRFGLPYWQMALTATDANRFAIRLALHITGRSLVLVFNYCYHGTVDEAYAKAGIPMSQSRQVSTSATFDCFCRSRRTPMAICATHKRLLWKSSNGETRRTTPDRCPAKCWPKPTASWRRSEKQSGLGKQTEGGIYD